MHTNQPLRAAQPGGDGGDGNGRGIGGQDAFLANDIFKVGEQLALDVEVFDNCLDHDGGTGDLLQAASASNALTCRVGVGGRHAAFLNQLAISLADVGKCLVDRVGARVEQAHLVARTGGDLGNARTHRAAADDAHHAACCQCTHAYSPLNCGVRFSMKALTPSR